MRSARPSGDPTNRSGRPSTRLGLLGCGEEGTWWPGGEGCDSSGVMG